MGTGPTCLLGAEFNPRCIVLISAYLSIKEVARNIVGRFLGTIVAEHFNNLDAIQKIDCPVLLIHG
jgi:hypothetical protein